MARYSGKECSLFTMITLTLLFFFVEITVGYYSNSMSLIADSFHMLSDVAALIVASLSVKMAPRKWSKNTYGWARAEVLGALVNTVFLSALCISITVEALKRFVEVEEIHQAGLLLGVGGVGLIINLIGLFLFYEHGISHGHSHSTHKSHDRLSTLSYDDLNENDDEYRSPLPLPPPSPQNNQSHEHKHNASQMNMRGVYLHVLYDAFGSGIVIISASIITWTDWEYKYYIDPAMSLVLVGLILKSVWPLLQESASILLQNVPTHIQVDEIHERLLENVDGVLAVDEFHVWQLAGDRIIASAHIKCRNLSDYMLIAERVKEFFHNEGIHSTTIQPEFVME